MYETQAGWPYFSPAVGRPLTAYPPAEGVLMPRVDIMESPEEFLYVFELPGIDPTATEVEIQRDQLRVTGEIAPPGVGQYTYRYQERPRGRFERIVSLAGMANAENITADSRQGLLFVHIPKRGAGVAVEARKITVGSPAAGPATSPLASPNQAPGTGQGFPAQ